MVTVGDKIREYRKMRNMTQAELAERVHVMQNTISSWESGRTEPRMGMIEVLAEVLNCRKSDLIGEVSVHELLSPKELRLIVAFRKLTDSQQDMIISVVNAAAGRR